MTLFKALSLSLFSLILSACTQAGLLVANVPGAFNDVKRMSSVVYGEHDLATLDIYQPPIASEKAAPVIVFIHGGRWTDGNKDQYRFVGDRLAQAGYVVVIPDYRKYPQVKFPELMEDEADAAAWVYKNIAQYGGQPENITLMGHSSGAHVAALLTADERYLKMRGVPHSSIKKFVGLSGPYDFEPREADLVDMFGPPDEYPKMQVSTFIDGGEPPMMLIWGADDQLVGKINIDRLVPVIREKGGSVDVKIYEGLDHGGTIKAFTWIFEEKSPVVPDILEFLKR